MDLRALVLGIWLLLWPLGVRFEVLNFASCRDILGSAIWRENFRSYIDNRGENKVLNSLRRLLPNLKEWILQQRCFALVGMTRPHLIKMEIIQITNKIGDGISYITESILTWLNSKGILTVPVVSKLVTMLLFLVIAFVVIKFANDLSKWIKLAIVFILIVLIIITGISFI